MDLNPFIFDVYVDGIDLILLLILGIIKNGEKNVK